MRAGSKPCVNREPLNHLRQLNNFRVKTTTFIYLFLFRETYCLFAIKVSVVWLIVLNYVLFVLSADVVLHLACNNQLGE